MRTSQSVTSFVAVLRVRRRGWIFGPLIGGQLLDLDWSAQQVFVVFAMPAVVSTLVMVALHVLLRAPAAARPVQQTA